jgi:hypothetical protein
MQEDAVQTWYDFDHQKQIEILKDLSVDEIVEQYKPASLDKTRVMG